MLEANHIGFSHGICKVLAGASFQASAGEFIAVTGNNGAGKSTLLEILAGLRKPDHGRVMISAREQSEWSPRELARMVSHLPQAVHADLPFTAEQVVGMGRYPHTDRLFESPRDLDTMRDAMQRTSSWAFRDRPFASLSGGERQRVLLAACLAQDASILLLDEPSTFLDIEAQLECFSLLRDEARKGKLCIAVTHDLNLALTYCSRLLVISEGFVKRDLASESCADSPEWLSLFSARLRMGQTEVGAPWVWYT